MPTEAPAGVVLVDGMRIGGTERQIVALLKGLRRSARVRMYLAVLDRGGELEDEAAALCAGLLPLRRRARFDASPAFALAWQARRLGVRFVHALGWMSGLAGLVAARLLRLPIINGSIRGTPPALRRRERISRWCALHSDVIVANSAAGLQSYQLEHHRRARVIGNGIDLSRFNGVAGEPDREPRICMVANFNQYKDQATVIRAMPAIRRAVPNARLVFVGNDAGTMAENRRIAQELAVAEALTFVTNTPQPEPHIIASQVCVLMSPEGEGFSNAVLEYMAIGRPVVATACGGNAVVIREGETGFLVPNQAADQLAARVIDLLQSPGRAQAMGEAGRRRVRDHFSMERMVADYEALYHFVLTQHARN
jgi:glycosyltransferase involved in cell wall biosynthesis